MAIEDETQLSLPLTAPETPELSIPEENDVSLVAGEEDTSVFTDEQVQVAGLRDKMGKLFRKDTTDAVDRLKGTPDAPEGPEPSGKPEGPEPTMKTPEEEATEQAQETVDAMLLGREEAKVKDYGIDEVNRREGVQYSGVLNLDADDVVKFETEELTDLVGTYLNVPDKMKIKDLIAKFTDDETAWTALSKEMGLNPGQAYPREQTAAAYLLRSRVTNLMDSLMTEITDPLTGKIAQEIPLDKIHSMNQLRGEFAALDLMARGMPSEAARILRLHREFISGDALGDYVHQNWMRDISDGGTARKFAEGWLASQKSGKKGAAEKFAQNSWGGNLNSALSELYRSNLLMNIPTMGKAAIGSAYMMHLYMPTERFAAANFSTLRRKVRAARGLPEVDPNADPLEAGVYYGEMKQFHRNVFQETMSMIDSFWKGTKSVLTDNPETMPKIAQGRMTARIDDYHEPSITGQKLIPSAMNAVPGTDWVRRGVDVYGRLQRSSFGVLSGMDAALKGHMYNRSLHNLAYRQAQNELRQQGMSPARDGSAFDEMLDGRINELVNDPSTELVTKAMAEADRATFTQRNRPGMFKLMAQGMSKLWPVLAFRQTPVNIMDEILDGVPIPEALRGPLGDYNTMTPAQKDASWGRFSIGIGMVTAAQFLMNNQAVVKVENEFWEPGDPEENRYRDAIVDRPILTGAGPRNKTEWANLYATGWRPFSIFVPAGSTFAKMLPETEQASCHQDGCYVPYGMFEPTATVLGMIVTGMEQLRSYEDDELNDKDMSQMTALMGIAVAEHFLDKSMMSGLSGLLSTAAHGGDWVQELGVGVTTSLVPGLGASGARQITADTDPYLRDTNMQAFMDEFYAVMDTRLPSSSEKQAARYDRWGRPILRPVGVLGFNAISPVNYSPASAHPEDIVMQRHQVAVKPVNHTQEFTLPSGRGDGIALKYQVDLRGIPSQYDEDGNAYPSNHVYQSLVKLVGDKRRAAVNDYVFSREYRDNRSVPEYAPESPKRRLRNILSQARQEAIEEWLSDPENVNYVRTFGKVTDRAGAPTMAPHMGGKVEQLDRDVDKLFEGR